MEKYFKVAAHGLIKKDNKYLVTRRSPVNDYMPGFWDTPGGTMEFGERVIDTLVREISEETTINVKTGKIFFTYGYVSNPKRHQIILVYECEYLSGEIKLNPKEHDEYRWVGLEEMAELKKISFLDELYKYIKENNE